MPRGVSIKREVFFNCLGSGLHDFWGSSNQFVAAKGNETTFT
ncbi:hypothetical protein POREN0001_0409 [Porphyromonas endodontalis ATCC 35406]|uniref:Uncharacterized protein n=1 Tax=Porphyromonas endodontalis (strain ATCC 35406 / DSM 24491 / JCM 8526 / CCUG 16442 / BCRC 14492 / NCTC 13058 / HG 370) TaxID=553175 RepID=C3JC10_POREA|nr:hypothetical protein POREN0001_0409 [Porphyromonas endodontalis ATCC 35406]